MYLRRYKISKAAFLKNTSQQLPLYIIWFRVSPKRKYYLMSETYLKPSQKSKMKVLAKVVNTCRDILRTVFSIQNVFRTSRMVFFAKIMNGRKPLSFSAKSSILDILLGPENSVNFQEKHSGEIAFLNKVAGYLTLTDNVLLGNLWNVIINVIRLN